MSEPTLFDTEPYEVEPTKLSRQQLLTIGQREKISRGFHPLSHTAGTGRLKLGPAGPTCGDCEFRTVGHNRAYPKCVFGKQERLQAYVGRAVKRPVYPRVDSSISTDCRKWWPACTDFQAKAVQS